MNKKVIINGTGRIGMCVARILTARMAKKEGYLDTELELVGINTTMDIDTLGHMLEFDSVHGKSKVAKLDEKHLSINDSAPVRIYSERDIKDHDFSATNASLLIECTGVFNSLDKAAPHLKNGIEKVIISAPAANTPTFVYGVNDKDYKGESIISNASCTTNCLAPLVQLLHTNSSILRGIMTTIHSYTNDQNLLDSKHKKGDLRRARAAALNMIPTSTGASRAIALVLPEMKGRLEGMAIRVPTADVSLVDLCVSLKNPLSLDELKSLIIEASQGRYKGIIEPDLRGLVSSDLIGSNKSATIIMDKLLVVDDMVKLLAWYDNEAGYVNRLIDMAGVISR